jgi:hypothetical protein
MNKPDFSNMTTKELKAYAMIHRDDSAVFNELIKRVEENPNTRTFSYDMTEDEEKRAMELMRSSGVREQSE